MGLEVRLQLTNTCLLVFFAEIKVRHGYYHEYNTCTQYDIGITAITDLMLDRGCDHKITTASKY